MVDRSQGPIPRICHQTEEQCNETLQIIDKYNMYLTGLLSPEQWQQLLIACAPAGQ